MMKLINPNLKGQLQSYSVEFINIFVSNNNTSSVIETNLSKCKTNYLKSYSFAYMYLIRESLHKLLASVNLNKSRSI